MENFPYHSPEIGELTKALVKVQAQILTAKKTSKNPFFRSSYAGLAEVWESCRKPLTDNGLAIIQSSRRGDGGEICIISTLAHTSGQWWSGELCIVPAKADPQTLGSCISYLRRYSLSALIGVVSEDEDDDGEAGTKHFRKKGSFQGEPDKPHVKIEEDPPKSRTGQVYSESTNNIIKSFDSIDMGIGNIEDILKHDLTNISDEELTMLRGIYADAMKKKQRKTRSDKGQPRKEQEAPGPTSPFTDAEMDVDDYVNHLPVPIRDEMKRLWWGANRMKQWLKEQGINDPAELMRNQEGFESILKKLGKLALDKK